MGGLGLPPGVRGATEGAAASPVEGSSTREGSALGQSLEPVKGPGEGGQGRGERGERGEVRVRGAAAEDKGSRHSMEEHVPGAG